MHEALSVQLRGTGRSMYVCMYLDRARVRVPARGGRPRALVAARRDGVRVVQRVDRRVEVLNVHVHNKRPKQYSTIARERIGTHSHRHSQLAPCAPHEKTEHRYTYDRTYAPDGSNTTLLASGLLNHPLNLRANVVTYYIPTHPIPSHKPHPPSKHKNHSHARRPPPPPHSPFPHRARAPQTPPAHPTASRTPARRPPRRRAPWPGATVRPSSPRRRRSRLVRARGRARRAGGCGRLR